MIEPRSLEEISNEVYALSCTANILSMICKANPDSFNGEEGSPSTETVKNALYALSINLEKLSKEIDAKAIADLKAHAAE